MLGAVTVFLAFVPWAVSQSAAPVIVEAMLALPDAPSAIAAPAAVGRLAPAKSMPAGSIFSAPDPNTPASKHDKYILSGQAVPPLAPQDKVVLGLKDAFSPFALVGIAASAGYSHLTNGSPNYGTNSTAFAQRFGAAAARDTSEGLFTDCIMANVFREDPRYYQMGDGHNIVKRAIYATTRVIITRTDGGHTSPNLALLSGYAGGAAMTNLYYPQLNRGFNQTALTFGGSLGGAVVGNLVSEFLSDTLQFVHLQKK
jgi:hypothetical protein